MGKPGYNPGAAEDPETNPDYQHDDAEVAEETDKESTSAEVG